MNDYEIHLVEELRAGRLTRRELVRRAGVMGLSTSAVGALLAACGSGGAGSSSSTGHTRAPAPVRGGSLKVSVIAPAAGIDPVMVNDSGGVMTVQQVGEYLIATDANLHLIPLLARAWKTGATPDVWTFELRRGVRFNDGSEMTADDVVATFDRLTDKSVASAALSAFAGVLSNGQIERIDAYTVRFHLDRPVASFPYYVTQTVPQTVILPKGYVIGSFAKQPIGTGPFLLESYNPQQAATLRRNRRYWRRDLPFLDRVSLDYYADTTSQSLALQNGSIDVMAETPYGGDQALFSDPSLKVTFVPSSGYRAIHMRTTVKPFSDQRVRQALALCLNRPQIVHALFGGHATLGDDHGVAPIFPSSVPIAQRHQDYATAKRLLAAAGYPRGMALKLVSERYLEIPQYVQIVQQMVKPIGVDISLDLMPQAAYYGSGHNQPWLQVPFGCVDWAGRGTVSQLLTPAYTCNGIWNAAKWCDPRFGRLLNELDATLALDRQRAISADLERIQSTAVPAIIAYWLNEPRAMRHQVHGIALTDTASLNLAHAYVRS
jgi:peptide/nickel transport system substrate-binding protein